MILVYGDINLDILVQTDGPKQYGSDVTGQINLRGGGEANRVARLCLQIKGGRPPFKNNQSEDK